MHKVAPYDVYAICRPPPPPPPPPPPAGGPSAAPPPPWTTVHGAVAPGR